MVLAHDPRSSHCWALTLEDVRDVRVSDIELAQDGQTHNQDGLHLMGSAARVTINGLTGRTGDDVVAIDSTESDPYGRGEDGPISSVAVTNVAVENVYSTGLFRTVADRTAPVEGVYASNLVMTEYRGGRPADRRSRDRPGRWSRGPCPRGDLLKSTEWERRRSSPHQQRTPTSKHVLSAS